MIEIGQFQVSDVCDLNVHEEKESSALTKECKLKLNHESDDQNGARLGRKVGEWTQPTNHAPINYLFKKT